MIGLHTCREGDPAMWVGEEIPAGFTAFTADTTTWVYDAASGLLLQKQDSSGQ